MDIFKLSVLSIIVCLLSVTLKQYKPEFSILLSISFGLVALAFVAPYLVEIIREFNSLGNKYAESDYIGFVLKITGIAFLARFTTEICRDCGEAATAAKVELAAKIMILVNALPLILKFISSLEGIVR